MLWNLFNFFTDATTGTTGGTTTAPVVTVVPTPAPVATPTPEPGPVELDAAVESQVIADVENAPAGSTITVDMEKADGTIATVVTKEMLQAAQDKDVTIEMDMGDYSWSIYGMDIEALDDIHDVDLEVTLNTNAIPSATVQALAGGKPTLQLSLTYSGDFGFNADLKFNVGLQYAGLNVSLYYYDSLGKLVFIDSSPVDADGNVSLTFSHASDYVVIIDEEVSETPETETTETPADSTVETETEKQSAGMPVWLIALVAVVVLAGVVLVSKRKKSEE